MALTYSPVKTTVFGDERVVIADITFDSSYATGGETVDLSQLGLTSVDHVTSGIGNVTTTFYTTQYDYTNKKMLAQTGGAQATSTGDLSALTVRVKFIGK